MSSPSSFSQFQLSINNALRKYRKCTKKNLLSYPLTARFASCSTPSDVLFVLRQQFEGPDQAWRSDELWTRWIKSLHPIVSVLFTLSTTLDARVRLAFPPVSTIFTGVCLLLLAAKDTRASQDTLIDILKRIEMCFRPLEIYLESLTTEKTDVIVQIMVEVLAILAIAMVEVSPGHIRKYLKTQIRKSEIEDSLKSLDWLIQEVLMATAVNVKVIPTIDNKVTLVDMAIGDEVISDGKEVMQEKTNDINEMKRNQFLESIQEWLSPPDPSTNHNAACGTYHRKAATWFIEGSIFQAWKSTASLLWIRGKPGSGKSVVCSTVIQEIEAMCEAGHASMAYFYFDFRDANKQCLRGLVTSLLAQLCVRSDSRCMILSDLHVAHGSGLKQPSDSTLMKCLKEMLTTPDRRPTYLIIDGLDESPNACGFPSPREGVIELLKELVGLPISNLHICVTSCPEIDIRYTVEPLAFHQMSLHDQSGQKKDVADYIRSVVYSSSEQFMRWKTEDKEHVIKTLSERTGSDVFQWASCQLETLRHCLPASVWRTLDDLPESLDETYARVLKDITKPNRGHARRILQCLAVAIRPLRVEELAEVRAIDVEDAKGIPKLRPDWRWEDQEQALLTLCPSLITVVRTGNSRIVQFSHFSVREFLTSARLATSSGDVSRYHIDLEHAHTTLAQACLGVLLQPGNHVDDDAIRKRSPLLGYAAEHWVTHMQFAGVPSCLRKAMEYLFDPDKPHFAAWLKVHNIDTELGRDSSLHTFTPDHQPASPLYYAALCGFQDLVQHVLDKSPQHLNSHGGWYVTPLIAALARGHLQIADFLHHNGADVDVLGFDGLTPLISASWFGDLEMVQRLLKYKANVNAKTNRNWSALHYVSMRDPKRCRHHSEWFSNIAELLLQHGADVNARGNACTTPLHTAVVNRRVEVVRMLLKHGANVDVEDSKGGTPSQIAAARRFDEIMGVLLEYGA